MVEGLPRARLHDVRLERGCSQALVIRAGAPPHDPARRDEVRAVLRSLLANVTGRAPESFLLEKSADGKPFVAGGSGLGFNLSHARRYSLLALSLSGEIGCDIEDRFTDGDVMALCSPVLHSSELEAMERLGPRERQHAFRRYWVRKEAVLKAAGTGFLGDPRQVVTGLDERHPRWAAAEGPCWVIHNREVEAGCVAAVASMDDDCRWNLLAG